MSARGGQVTSGPDEPVVRAKSEAPKLRASKQATAKASPRASATVVLVVGCRQPDRGVGLADPLAKERTNDEGLRATEGP